MRFLTLAGLAALAAGSMVPLGGAAAQNPLHWKGRIAAGKAIEIKNINGDVRAAATTGSEVEVTATKRGHRSDPDEVKIEVVKHDGGVTICAVYPDGDPRHPNDCVPGAGGHMNAHDNDVKVQFTVHVPAGVDFVGRSVNGEVEADSLRGNAEAYTVNGGVQVSTSGYAEAATVNGSISASLGRVEWTGPLEFRTVNGGITVELPAKLNADVHAETLNGSIDTDFPLTVSGRFSPKRLTGTIGSGGRTLSLATVNGTIRLRKKP